MTRTATERGITLCNGRLGAALGSVRIVGSRIVAIDTQPHPDDVLIDLHGDRILPGLINAHDHLQLNGVERQPCRDRYENVRGWIEDVAAQRANHASFGNLTADSRDQRLWLGGIKNLLSGVTTVAHHDPFYDYLRHEDFPTQVVSQYGWSHSLLIDGDEAVQQSLRKTPVSQPWIIHAAEGVDREAHEEFERLERLGCIGPNTLIVHGVALDAGQRQRLSAAGGALIWCPASNIHLFGETAQVADLVGQGRVALGTDSRLSGSRDLLSELQLAQEVAGLADETLESLVSATAARLLRIPDRGVIRAGAAADVVILPAHLPLAKAKRADLRLVMIAGRMHYGDREYARLLAPEYEWSDVMVDGTSKVLDRCIAGLLARTDVRERGVELAKQEWRAA